MASIIKTTLDGKPGAPLIESEVAYDKVTNEIYVGSGTGTADGNKLSKDAGEIQVTRNNELDLHMDSTFAQHGLIPNDGVNEIRPKDIFEEVDIPDVLVDKKGYPVRFTDGVYDRFGNELVTNGKFLNLDGWNNKKGVAKNVNGQLILDGSTNDMRVETDTKFTLYANKIYMLEFDYNSYTHYDFQRVIVENVFMASTNSDEASKNGFISNVGKQRFIFKVNTTIQCSIAVKSGYSGQTMKIGNLSLKEVPQFSLPKAPFATDSTDELLDDKVSGVTTQTNHNKGDIVVCGNELVSTTSYLNVTSGTDFGIDNNCPVIAGIDYQVIIKYTATAGANLRLKDGTNTDNTLFNLPITVDGLEHEINVVGQFYNSSSGVRLEADSNQFTGNILSISIKAKDDSYIALQDTTAGDLLTDITKFKAISYVTKQVALLIEKTNTGAILNTVKSLVNMYGEENILTYETDIFNELGFGQKADRVWSDGSSEFILVGLKGYLNNSSYHPFFNKFGTNVFNFGGQRNWYHGDVVGINSVYDCCSSVGVSANIGSINLNWGRPDSKLYDKTYIEGQGGLVCYSIPNAKTPTYKHQEEVRRNLIDGYIEDGVELSKAYKITENTAGSSEYYPNFKQGSILETLMNKAIAYELFAKVYVIDYGYCMLSKGAVNGDSRFIRFFNLNGVPIGNIGHTKQVLYDSKSPYLVTQGNQTHIDLIGDPSPYNPTDATYISPTSVSITDMPTNTLVWDNATSKMYKAIVATNDLDASGLPIPAFTDDTAWVEISKGYPVELRNRLVRGKGNNLTANLADDSGNGNIPNGIKTTFKISQKVTDQLQVLNSTDSGVTWTVKSVTFDSVANTVTFGTAPEANAVIMISSNVYNQPAISIDTPQPIVSVDRNLIASNSHSVYAYNGLTYASSDKVATGNSVESKYTDDIVVDNTGTVTTSPKHNAIQITDGTSIVGSKALITRTSNATQVFTQEMIYDSTNSDWGDTGQFDQLTNGTTPNLDAVNVQTKVLLKPSSCKLGDK